MSHSGRVDGSLSTFSKLLVGLILHLLSFHICAEAEISGLTERLRHIFHSRLVEGLEVGCDGAVATVGGTSVSTHKWGVPPTFGLGQLHRVEIFRDLGYAKICAL